MLYVFFKKNSNENLTGFDELLRIPIEFATKSN